MSIHSAARIRNKGKTKREDGWNKHLFLKDVIDIFHIKFAWHPWEQQQTIPTNDGWEREEEGEGDRERGGTKRSRLNSLFDGGVSEIQIYIRSSHRRMNGRQVCSFTKKSVFGKKMLLFFV